LQRVVDVYRLLGSRIVEMDCDTHDRVTADTQVITHVGYACPTAQRSHSLRAMHPDPWAAIGRFLAMGTAWANARVYPWENRAYVGGIDNAKILMALRIYGMKHHVYSGAFYPNTQRRAFGSLPAIYPSKHFMQGWRCTTRTQRGRSSSTRCPSRS
jgi:prephenate dehydrogenase (NADP+)